MHPNRKVMLFPSGKAGSPELEDIPYPRYVSNKLDGSYCLAFHGQLYSRRLKLHPNRFLVDRFAPLLSLGILKSMVFMAELCSPEEQFSEGQSIFRSHAGDLGRTSLFVFDCLPLKAYMSGDGWLPFKHRYARYLTEVEQLNHEFIRPVYQQLVTSVDEARILYEAAVGSGLEGIVTRDSEAYYKFGRCTGGETNLFRHTESIRCDGLVVDVVEGHEMRDHVQPPILADGSAGRSYRKDDYRPAGIAGSLTVQLECGTKTGVGFGRGWTTENKRRVWEERNRFIGRTVEIEYKKAGVKDRPRQPKLVRFRDDK